MFEKAAPALIWWLLDGDMLLKFQFVLFPGLFMEETDFLEGDFDI